MTEKTVEITPTHPKNLNYLILLGLSLLVGAAIFFGIRLNQANKKIALIEARSALDHQQLNKFNQILGKSLDSEDISGGMSEIDEKISLEIFDKISALLRRVDALAMQPSKQTMSKPLEVEGPITQPKVSANAEMRWWGKLGRFVIQPIKEYFTSLVKVQVMDAPVGELAMSSNSQKMIREELMLRIFTARGLVLHGLLHQTIEELQVVKKLTEVNFALQDKNTQTFLDDVNLVLNDLHALEKTQKKSVSGK
jgi:hypothetical protein